MKPNAPPKFHRARPVPFAIKDIIGDEFDCLEKDGILEKVMHSDLPSWQFQNKMESSESVEITRQLSTHP